MMFGQARSHPVLMGLRQPHDHRRRACSASRRTSLLRAGHDVTSCTRPANRTDSEHATPLGLDRLSALLADGSAGEVKVTTRKGEPSVVGFAFTERVNFRLFPG